MNRHEMQERGLVYLYQRFVETENTSRIIVTESWAKEHKVWIEDRGAGWVRWIEYPENMIANKYRITYKDERGMRGVNGVREWEVRVDTFEEAYSRAVEQMDLWKYEEIIKIELVSVSYG